VGHSTAARAGTVGHAGLRDLTSSPMDGCLHASLVEK
jgi:hypothetical protein